MEEIVWYNKKGLLDILRGIEFTDKRFKKKDDYNLFYPLTSNTIVLCNNYRLMDSLSKEILNTVNGFAKYNNYDCDKKDIGEAKECLVFGLQRIIDINGQRITLALEPSIIYQANNIEDIWLFDWSGDEELEVHPYEEFIYPFYIFKGSQEVWNSGKDEVYKMICNGRCGAYDGKWVDLHGENNKSNKAAKCISGTDIHLNT